MSNAFDSVNLQQAMLEFDAIHNCVLDGCGRVEIAGPNGACVLISKAELQCMEQAIEIFAGTPAGKNMCDELARIVSALAPGTFINAHHDAGDCGSSAPQA